MPSPSPTAAVLLIGNELLSGRTQDKNLHTIAEKLQPCGIPVREARIVTDNEDAIIAALNDLRQRYTYVFTTGGIGPTHDDITAASVAKAFGVTLYEHPGALEALQKHYTKEALNKARLKMALAPQGADLIPNRVSAAPGFVMDNVYVLAGIPRIMQAMLDEVIPTLQGGTPLQSIAVQAFIPEGNLAAPLADLQQRYPQLDIGSYPFWQNGHVGVNLVVRGEQGDDFQACGQALQQLVQRLSA